MKKLSIWWTKLTINSIVQIFILIAAIFAIYYSAISYSNYGWEYVINPDFDLPNSDRSARMFMILLLDIFVFQSIFNIYISFRLHDTDKKWFVYTGGIFTWLLLPLFIYTGIKENHFRYYRMHIATERYEGLQISHLHVWNCIKYRTRKDKLFRNTLLAYLTFFITLVGFIIIWIPKNSYEGMPFLSFEVFTFFTQWSNLMCFFFMLAFLLFHKKIVFKQNILLSYLATYIFIVGLVFWAVLLPFYSRVSEVIVKPLRVFTHIWLHTCTPIAIVVFAIRCYHINYVMPQINVHKYCVKGCIIPAVYAVYAYIIPFTMQYSVYGPLTNLNSSMLNENGKPMGYWWMIFAAVVAIGLFVGALRFFRWINIKAAKNHQAEAHYYANQNSFSKITARHESDQL